MNCSEIIFGLCEFLSAVSHNIPSSFASRDVSSGSELSFSFFGECRDLAGLGAIGRVVVAVRLENGMHAIHTFNPFHQSLVRILMIAAPRLLRIHAAPATCDDGTVISSHMRP